MSQPFANCPADALKSIKLLVLDVDGVMTDGKVSFSETEESKTYDVQDGMGIKLAQQYGIEVAIISARHSESTRRRAENLGIAHVHQGVRDKVPAFESLLKTLDLPTVETLFIGDDIIDIPLFNRAGIGVCPDNAHPAIKACVDWMTERRGGDGAIREVCDALLTARGDLQAHLQQLKTR